MTPIHNARPQESGFGTEIYFHSRSVLQHLQRLARSLDKAEAQSPPACGDEHMARCKHSRLIPRDAYSFERLIRALLERAVAAGAIGSASQGARSISVKWDDPPLLTRHVCANERETARHGVEGVAVAQPFRAKPLFEEATNRGYIGRAAGHEDRVDLIDL